MCLSHRGALALLREIFYFFNSQYNQLMLLIARLLPTLPANPFALGFRLPSSLPTKDCNFADTIVSRFLGLQSQCTPHQIHDAFATAAGFQVPSTAHATGNT